MQLQSAESIPFEVGALGFFIDQGEMRYILVQKKDANQFVYWDIARMMYVNEPFQPRKLACKALLHDTKLVGESSVSQFHRTKPEGSDHQLTVCAVEVSQNLNQQVWNKLTSFTYHEAEQLLASGEMKFALDACDKFIRSEYSFLTLLKRQTPSELVAVMKRISTIYGKLWQYWDAKYPEGRVDPIEVTVEEKDWDLMQDAMSKIAVTTALSRYFGLTSFILNVDERKLAVMKPGADYTAWLLDTMGLSWENVYSIFAEYHPEQDVLFESLAKKAWHKEGDGFAGTFDEFGASKTMALHPLVRALEEHYRVVFAYDGKSIAARRVTRNTAKFAEFCSYEHYLNLPVI